MSITQYFPNFPVQHEDMRLVQSFLKLRKKIQFMADNVLGGRWNDLQGQLSLGLGSAAPSREPYRVATDGFDDYVFNSIGTPNDIHLNYQLAHSYRPGNEIRFHLHTIPLAVVPVAPANVVSYEWWWWWAVVGVDIPPFGPCTTNPVPTPGNPHWHHGITNQILAPGDEYEPKAITLFTTGADTPPATGPGASNVSNMIKVKFRRLTGGADTYKALKTTYNGAVGPNFTPQKNLAIDFADCHFQQFQSGTILEFIYG